MGTPYGIDPTTRRTMSGHYTAELHLVLGVTESFLFLFFLGGGDGQRGDRPYSGGWGGGQEDGIAMKDAQSKVKWGGAMGAHSVNGAMDSRPPS